MNLGVFLAIGESLDDFKLKGQLKRLLNYNVKKYSQNFDKVYIFSYADEDYKIFENCVLIPNKFKIHRYLYALILPFLHRELIKKINIFRGLQITGGIPSFVSKVFYQKPYVINFGYDYASFARIEGKLIQSLLYRLIQGPVLKFADAVIVTSQDIKKVLLKNIKSPKIYLIPNGVDTNLFKPHKNLPNKILTLLYMGRLEKQKNLESLVYATSGIEKVRLIFYGEGSQKSHLQKLAKTKNVDLHVKNPIDYFQVPKVISRADIFILPSIKEGNPKILLEAMSCAKPVIGTNVSGIKELIKDSENGVLSESDPDSLAKAINFLSDSKIRDKIAQPA